MQETAKQKPGRPRGLSKHPITEHTRELISVGSLLREVRLSQKMKARELAHRLWGNKDKATEVIKMELGKRPVGKLMLARILKELNHKIEVRLVPLKGGA